MSFFKDFKEDFSEAVNELMPEENAEEVTAEAAAEAAPEDAMQKALDDISVEAPASELFAADEPKVTPTPAPTQIFNNATAAQSEEPVEKEVAIITKGMVITGDISANGPVEIRGTVNGNITSRGKITVTGHIIGDTDAVEVFADNANIEGEIKTQGTVKVGQSSVIKGSINATSAVIAGAVKGDIDVHGPVVVDTTAIVVGNIKSKSVQINNGAIIEGFCSQCYSDIDMKSLFGE